MTVLNTVSLLTFFEETVAQGIGPSGVSGVSTGAQWVAAEAATTAFQVPHIASSLSTSSIETEEVTPDQVKRRIFETERSQEALSNTQFPFQSFMTGTGSALADGVTATATSLSRLLLNALGGVSFAPTRTLAGGGHTTTVVNVDDATGLEVGQVISWEDSDGLCHPRVITDITVLAVTLNTALPATPVDTDLMRGGITGYIDEDVIGDTSSNLGSTLSGSIQKGANGNAGWEVNGCKVQLGTLTFGRNEFPLVDFSVWSARHTDPSLGPDPTYPTATFPTPQVMGPDSSIIIEDAGTTTLSTVCNGSATIDAGVPVVPLECMADNLGDMEGYGLYSSAPADTLLEVDVFPFDTSWYVDKAADTNKQVAVIKHADSGNTFAFFAQNCEIRTVVGGDGDFTSSNLTLRAVEHNPDTATTALERSKFRIYIG